MKYLLITIFILFTSCDEKTDFELEIVSKQINSLNIKPEDFYDYYKEKIINSKAKTIVTYKLINNTESTYYFNLDGNNKILETNLRIDRAYLIITDLNQKQIKSYSSSPSLGSESTFPNDLMILKELNYNPMKLFKNFIIHSHETLYFEWVLVLPYGNIYEYNNYWIKDLDAQKKYFAEITLSSNGVNYKKQISRTDLQTVQDNGYKVYNGIIKSKNKVPIIFK